VAVICTGTNKNLDNNNTISVSITNQNQSTSALLQLLSLLADNIFHNIHHDVQVLPKLTRLTEKPLSPKWQQRPPSTSAN